MNEDVIVAAFRQRALERHSPPPAPIEAIARAEGIIGFPFPPLLRRLYVEVSDGGFGPSDGVLPVDVPEDWQDHLGAEYADGPDPADGTPAGVVRLYDWGCGEWSWVDFRDPDGPMWSNQDDDCWPQGVTLAQWLVAALNDELTYAWPNGVPSTSE